jgi:hypothetical protein
MTRGGAAIACMTSFIQDVNFDSSKTGTHRQFLSRDHRLAIAAAGRHARP